MPKIRGIKPEFWTDEDITDLSIPARLLFIGLWTYACDNGHVQDKPKQIKLRILPGDDVNVAELLRELEQKGRITRQDGWITIPNFARHQKPDKRYFQTCELTGCARPGGDSQPDTRGAPAVAPMGAPRAPAVVSEGPHVDGDGDGDGDGDIRADKPPAAATAQTFVAEWIDHCRERPPSDIIGQVSKRLKALVDDGIDPAVIRRGLAEWDRKGLHPSALPSVVHEAQKANGSNVVHLPDGRVKLPPLPPKTPWGPA